MELPYKGRAIINEVFNGIEIIIPAKKNWFTAIFAFLWLTGWFIGGGFIIVKTIRQYVQSPVGLFDISWMAIWLLAVLVVLRKLLWNIRGKEIITVGQGQLIIQKKGAILLKPKTYDLNEVKNMRVQDDGLMSNSMLMRRDSIGSLEIGGTIRFDYGFKTIKFAAGIDEAEANFIVEKMKNYGISSQREYGFKLN